MDIDNDVSDQSQSGENGAGEQFQKKSATGTGSTSRTGGPGKEKNMEFWKRFVKLFDSLVFKTVIKTAVVVILGLMAIGAFVYYDPMNLGFPKISIGDQQVIAVEPTANKLPGDFPMPTKKPALKKPAPSAPAAPVVKVSEPAAQAVKVSEPAAPVANVSEPATPVANVSEPATPAVQSVSVIEEKVFSAPLWNEWTNETGLTLYARFFGVHWPAGGTATVVAIPPGKGLVWPGLDVYGGDHFCLYDTHNNGKEYTWEQVEKNPSLGRYHNPDGSIVRFGYGRNMIVVGMDGRLYSGLAYKDGDRSQDYNWLLNNPAKSGKITLAVVTNKGDLIATLNNEK